jgi:hypothetical protein
VGYWGWKTHGFRAQGSEWTAPYSSSHLSWHGETGGSADRRQSTAFSMRLHGGTLEHCQRRFQERQVSSIQAQPSTEAPSARPLSITDHQHLESEHLQLVGTLAKDARSLNSSSNRPQLHVHPLISGGPSRAAAKHLAGEHWDVSGSTADKPHQAVEGSSTKRRRLGMKLEPQRSR